MWPLQVCGEERMISSWNTWHECEFLMSHIRPPVSAMYVPESTCGIHCAGLDEGGGVEGGQKNFSIYSNELLTANGSRLTFLIENRSLPWPRCARTRDHNIFHLIVLWKVDCSQMRDLILSGSLASIDPARGGGDRMTLTRTSNESYTIYSNESYLGMR